MIARAVARARCMTAGGRCMAARGGRGGDPAPAREWHEGRGVPWSRCASANRGPTAALPVRIAAARQDSLAWFHFRLGRFDSYAKFWVIDEFLTSTALRVRSFQLVELRTQEWPLLSQLHPYHAWNFKLPSSSLLPFCKRPSVLSPRSCWFLRDENYTTKRLFRFGSRFG